MTSNLTWKHLSLKQIEAYTKLPDPASRLKFLSKTFPVSPEPERAGIELDLYFYVLQFGIERAFTPDKISVLFSIFKQTHAESMRCDPSRSIAYAAFPRSGGGMVCSAPAAFCCGLSN